MLSALRAGEAAGAASTADPALPGTSRARGRRFGSPAAVSSSGRSAAAPLAARHPSSATVANAWAGGAPTGAPAGVPGVGGAAGPAAGHSSANGGGGGAPAGGAAPAGAPPPAGPGPP